jgi:Xaa-Pro aminopeptidase
VKRGLVALDVPGLPGRVRGLQRRLAADGLAAAAIYGDVHRSGDISYLTNLCLYWNEGVLVVPAEGEPVLLTKLSARVQPWMQETSTLRDIRSGPNMAGLLAGLLRDRAPGVLGLVERAWWPAPLADQVAQALPSWSVRDLGPMLRPARLRLSAAEADVLRAGGAVTAATLAAACEGGLSEPERIGLGEWRARAAGVEDAVIRCRAGGVEVLTEYRGYWTMAARPFPDALPLSEAHAAVRAALQPGGPIAALDEAAAGVLGHGDWELDVLDHLDLETGGDYRSAPPPHLLPGSAVAVRLARRTDRGWAALADTYLLRDGGAECLTSSGGGQ